MSIPTESIGSIPRPPQLLEALREFRAGGLSQQRLDACYDEALRNTMQRFADTGSPVISDGEQTKSSFATYPLQGLRNIAEDGIVIPFADGHSRQLPRLTAGPFRYGLYAGAFVQAAKRYTTRPLKQAVISASALSLLYPQEGIAGYSREAFIDDLVQRKRWRIFAAVWNKAPTVCKLISPKGACRSNSIRPSNCCGILSI